METILSQNTSLVASLAQRLRVQGVRAAHQPLPGRAALVQGGPAVVGADSGLELALGEPGADPLGLDQVPDLDRQGVGVGVTPRPSRMAASSVTKRPRAPCTPISLAERPQARPSATMTW